MPVVSMVRYPRFHITGLLGIDKEPRQKTRATGTEARAPERKQPGSFCRVPREQALVWMFAGVSSVNVICRRELLLGVSAFGRGVERKARPW